MFSYYIWKDGKVHILCESEGQGYPLTDFYNGGFAGCYCFDPEMNADYYKYGKLNSDNLNRSFIPEEKDNFPSEFMLALTVLGVI